MTSQNVASNNVSQRDFSPNAESFPSLVDALESDIPQNDVSPNAFETVVSNDDIPQIDVSPNASKTVDLNDDIPQIEAPRGVTSNKAATKNGASKEDSLETDTRQNDVSQRDVFRGKNSFLLCFVLLTCKSVSQSVLLV